MGTIDTAKTLNDTRQRAHVAARDILERAVAEGRGLGPSEKAAIARADQIIADSQSARDELLRREEAIATLDGVTDEFRRTGGLGDLEGRHALEKLAFRGTLGQATGGGAEVELDLAPAARAFQAFRAGARGFELRAFTGDTSSATGGSLTMPTDVALGVYATMTQASAMRQTRATIITTSGGNRMRFPRVATHGIGTQVAGQTTGFAGTDPTLGVMDLDAFDAGQLIAVASDFLEDSGTDVLGFVAQNAGRALGRLTDTWYVTGSGSGMPQGVTTAGAVGAAGTVATGGSLIYGPVEHVGEKLWDLVYSIDSQYRQVGEWLMADATAHDFRKVRDGAGGTLGRWLFEMSPTSGLPGGTCDRLCGYPLRTDSNVASLASAASIAVFGDFSAYYVRDVRSVRLSRSDANRFDTNESVIRALLRTDGDLIDHTALNVLRAVVA